MSPPCSSNLSPHTYSGASIIRPCQETSPDRPDDGWRDQAACTRADPRLFTDPRPDTNDTRHAIEHCHACPVRQACLTTALTHHPDADVGIWGGTTPEARRTIRRRSTLPAEPEPTVGLFPTLQGDLTDLSGRALVVTLPVAPSLLLLIDGRPVLRTDQRDEIQRHLATTLEDYQPSRLAPLALTTSGDLADPTGRVTITRLPTPPHLLLVVDGRPHRRAPDLQHARRDAIRTLTRLPPAALPVLEDNRPARGRLPSSPGSAPLPPRPRHREAQARHAAARR